jgi:hypothetical protein
LSPVGPTIEGSTGWASPSAGMPQTPTPPRAVSATTSPPSLASPAGCLRPVCGPAIVRSGAGLPDASAA